MPERFPRQGVYVITPDWLQGDALLTAVARAVAGGSAAVQYRAKKGCIRDRVAEAKGIRQICRAAGIPFIVNDDPELTRIVAADGVHLGRDDGTVAEARALLGEEAIIGVSCYDSVDQACRAQAEGADYVAFGSFFPSLTKPGAPRARLGTLIDAKSRVSLPLVAIGGIDLDNASLLIGAGADLIAVIEAVFGKADIGRACHLLKALFPAPER
jgi:thiamine-phosphate pyrophosphorylase